MGHQEGPGPAWGLPAGHSFTGQEDSPQRAHHPLSRPKDSGAPVFMPSFIFVFIFNFLESFWGLLALTACSLQTCNFFDWLKSEAARCWGHSGHLPSREGGRGLDSVVSCPGMNPGRGWGRCEVVMRGRDCRCDVFMVKHGEQAKRPSVVGPSRKFCGRSQRRKRPSQHGRARAHVGLRAIPGRMRPS